MIVGISGLAGSGKDTCADFLVRDHGFVKVALADPIKRMTAEAFGFSFDQLWGPSSERNKPDERYPRRHTWTRTSEWCVCCGASSASAPQLPQCYLTPRFALQQLGSEWGRNCYPDVWVDYVVRVYQRLQWAPFIYTASDGLRLARGNVETRHSVVVPDVRFKNEIDGLRAHGAKLIRIVRSGSGLAGAAGKHTSETEQGLIPDGAFDAVIPNDGTLAELGEAVGRWMAEL
jgi:hypothetical protein